MSGTTGTVRTGSYLLQSEFQDGQAAGSITPQDMRDFIVSTASVLANTQTANYTLALTDWGQVVEMNLASANTITVPPNSSVAFPVGVIVQIHQYGAGTTTIAQGAGVTVRTPSTLVLRTQFSTATLRQRATNEWVLTGDVT